MVRHFRLRPAVELAPAVDVPGPVSATGFDVPRLQGLIRTSFAAIDPDADPTVRLAEMHRRLSRITLTKHHGESGIAMTMALDYTLTAVHLPEPLTTDHDCRAASDILSLLASALHRATTAATGAIAADMAAVLGDDHA